MTTIENPTGCPVTNLTDVNVASAPAGLIELRRSTEP